MNLIDIVLIVVMLFSVWRGTRNGFILESLNLASWIVSIALTFLLYSHLVSFLEKVMSAQGVWTVPLAFIITLIVCSVAISVIADWFLSYIPDVLHFNRANRILGLIPGFIGGVVKASIVAALFLLLPLFPKLSDATRESRIADKLTEQFSKIESLISPGLANVQRSLNKMRIETGSEKLVKLGFTVTKTRTRSDLEAQMLQMINEERRKVGLHELAADPELSMVARRHSADMFARGYFSHMSPDGVSPFDRIRNAGVGFLTAGENLALAQTLSLAHEGLMNSPGHRANILNKSYGRAGIGILDGGIYGLMITQNFRN